MNSRLLLLSLLFAAVLLITGSADVFYCFPKLTRSSILSAFLFVLSRLSAKCKRKRHIFQCIHRSHQMKRLKYKPTFSPLNFTSSFLSSARYASPLRSLPRESVFPVRQAYSKESIFRNRTFRRSHKILPRTLKTNAVQCPDDRIADTIQFIQVFHTDNLPHCLLLLLLYSFCLLFYLLSQHIRIFGSQICLLRNSDALYLYRIICLLDFAMYL